MYVATDINILVEVILTPTWINNFMISKVWYEITYPFPNFSDASLKFGNG